VVGNAALMFDPTDIEQIADGLERIIVDARLAADLRSRGPQQSAKFSWDTAAEKTAHLYRCTARHA
jgi:glycosyltransferase involved in cell wall biosynthesis